MPDLNGSLTVGQPAVRPTVRSSLPMALCIATLGLAACHDDSTTAPLAATSVTVLSGGSQSGTVGAALATPVVLQVKDQNGKAMVGVAVNITAGTGSGSIPTSQLTTDANGQVTTAWTLGTVAGTDTLNVQAGSLSAVQVLATTDAFGMAVDSLTLGPNAGIDDVTASIDTATGTVTTTLHETAS